VCTQYCHESAREKARDGQAIARLDEAKRFAHTQSVMQNQADVEKNKRFAVPLLKKFAEDLKKRNLHEAVSSISFKRAESGTLAQQRASKQAWYWSYFLPSALSDQQKRDGIVPDQNCILCGQVYSNYSTDGKLFQGINSTLENHLVTGKKHSGSKSILQQYIKDLANPPKPADYSGQHLSADSFTLPPRPPASRQGTLILQRDATIPIWTAGHKRLADEKDFTQARAMISTT